MSEICYKNNSLKQVIARIDLVSPLPKLASELPKRLSKIALKHFPIGEPQPGFTQEVFFSQEQLSARKQEFTTWNFFGRNREKHLRITQDHFFIAYESYQTFENLSKEFLEITDVFFKNFPEAQPSRLGLRYINELKQPGINPLDWKDYISKDLLSLLSYTVNTASLSRVWHNLEFVFDGFNLRFQFGIHNPDFPAPIRRRAFILDYDAYFQGLLEPTEISEYLNKYHDAIQQMFEKNITNKLRSVMNEPAK